MTAPAADSVETPYGWIIAAASHLLVATAIGVSLSLIHI